jgi:hypothetical protein
MFCAEKMVQMSSESACTEEAGSFTLRARRRHPPSSDYGETPHLLRYELLAVVTTPSQLKPCICGTDGA